MSPKTLVWKICSTPADLSVMKVVLVSKENPVTGDYPIWMFCPDMGRYSYATPKGVMQRIRHMLLEQSNGRQVDYGASIATGEFCGAILKNLERRLALVSTHQIIDNLQQSAFRSKLESRFMTATTLSGAPMGLSEYGCRAWLDATGYPVGAFTFRAFFAKEMYPIIFTHHTLSCPQYMHEVIIPLVLSSSFPFDTFVCTSRAARCQVKNLVERVVEDVRCHFGVNRTFAGDIEVIPFGVDVDRFQPRDRRKARRRFGLDSNSFTILYVGRLSPTDKADIVPFLGTIRELSRRIRPRSLKIIIAGGSYHGYDSVIKNYVRQEKLGSTVTVLGRVSDVELPDLYCAADVFLALSDNIQECFGLSAIEAMSCGIPQVVPDWSGFRDTVTDGVTGFRVPTYWSPCDHEISHLAAVSPDAWPWSHFVLAQAVAIDLDILLSRLTTLATHPNLCREMSAASVKRAREVYDWKIIVRAYNSIIDAKALEVDTYSGPMKLGRPVGVSDLFASTSHFASSILADETLLSHSGLHGTPPQMHPSYVQHFRELDPCFVEDPFEVVTTLPSATDVKTCLGYLKQRLGCTEIEARRQMMWLIKYGYLTVVKLHE